jgi:hypothetical protein
MDDMNDEKLFDLTEQQAQFRKECHNAILKALPTQIAEDYVTECEHQAGYEYWGQFETPGHAVHDARLYWDAITEPPSAYKRYEAEWKV